MNFEIVHRDRTPDRVQTGRYLQIEARFTAIRLMIHRLLVMWARRARSYTCVAACSVVQAVGGVEVVVRVRVRGRRVPPRRWRGSLRRETRHWRARPHRGLELGPRPGELLERWSVALREVQLGLHHSGCRRQGPRGLGRISAPRFSCMRIHVVVDVLLYFWLSGKSPPAVGHWAAERSVTLVRPRVLVQDGLLSEIFTALRALVWLLACVDTQVLVEDGSLTEEARAVHAAVWFLIGVDAQVLR